MIRQQIEHKANSDREKLLFNINKALDKIDGTYRTLNIVICDDFPAASLSQRGYLWGVVYKIIEKETGTNAQDLHDIFIERFGDPMHLQQIGVGQYRLSTKTYSTKNMTQYIEKVRAWANEQGLYIPQANEVPDETYLKLHM